MKVSEIDINPVTQYIDTDKLTPLEGNPRNISKQDLETLKKSIKDNPDYFWARPLLVNNANGKLVVYAGNQRLKAAKALQMRTVPCIVETLSDDKQKERTIRDNVQNGEWDLELLKGWDTVNLANWGLDADLIAELVPPLQVNEDDFNPETAYDQAKNSTTVKLGDIYILGNHRLMCGDSTKPEDVDKLLKGEKIDLLLTDPPYGIDIVKTKSTVSESHLSSGFNNIKKSINRDNITCADTSKVVPVNRYSKIEGDDKPFDPTPLLNYGKNQVIFGGNYFCNKLPESSCWLVWDKRDDIPSNNFADCELAWTSFDKPSRVIKWKWSGLLREGKRDTELTKRIHPTQKPVGVMAEILQDYSEANNNILDLYGGSGSVLIACEQLNRKCYMAEIDCVYVEIICQRWEKLTNKKRVKL